LSKELAKGFIKAGAGCSGTSWNILGQKYFPKACCDASFVFEANSMPGDFFPVHIHGLQDKLLCVLEGVLDVKLDGQWMKAKPGDLVRMPRGISHGYFNLSDRPVRALIWVTPAASLQTLFKKLDGVKNVDEVVKLSAQYGMEFLPPEANE